MRGGVTYYPQRRRIGFLQQFERDVLGERLAQVDEALARRIVSGIHGLFCLRGFRLGIGGIRAPGLPREA